MERRHDLGGHGVEPGARGRGRGRGRGSWAARSTACAAEWASYLFELQLGPPANVGIGVEGCYYATSNGGGIHLGVKMRACTYRAVVGCLPRGRRGKGGIVLMRVSSVCSALLCGLRCGAVRCGAVRWVNNAAYRGWHLTKSFGGQKRQARAGQGRSGAAETNCSTDPGVLAICDSTVEAECPTWGCLFFFNPQYLLCCIHSSLSPDQGQTARGYHSSYSSCYRRLDAALFAP